VSVSIRPDRGEEAQAIRAIHLAAFPTALEADLVEQLQMDGDVEISLVAEQHGIAIGHVVMSRMRCEGGGREFRALGLAPVAVLPERQRHGVGSALIGAALAMAREAGEELVFVVGAPEYYRRFGFSEATAAPFASPYAGPYLMAQTLGAIELPACGQADYAPAFAGLE
jgi:putative acetyltransferase